MKGWCIDIPFGMHMHLLHITRNAKSKDKFTLPYQVIIYTHYEHSKTDHLCIFAIFCIDLFLLYHLCQKGYQHTTLHKRGISYYWTFPETIPIVCSTSIFQRIIGEQVKPILWQSDNICCILINTMCVISFESSIWAMSIIDRINSYENRCSKNLVTRYIYMN